MQLDVLCLDAAEFHNRIAGSQSCIFQYWECWLIDYLLIKLYKQSTSLAHASEKYEYNINRILSQGSGVFANGLHKWGLKCISDIAYYMTITIPHKNWSMRMECMHFLVHEANRNVQFCFWSKIWLTIRIYVIIAQASRYKFTNCLFPKTF